jgi:hypothetical protein
MTTSGTGYKLFGSGDILRASEVNDYLMNQSVMVFADAGARDSALPTPGDGQVCYLIDINNKVLQVHKDGPGWVTIGLNQDIRDAQIMTFMQAI